MTWVIHGIVSFPVESNSAHIIMVGVTIQRGFPTRRESSMNAIHNFYRIALTLYIHVLGTMNFIDYS